MENSDKKSRTQLTKIRKLIIGFVALLALIAIIGVVWVVWVGQSGEPTASEDQKALAKERSRQALKDGTLRDKAVEAIGNNNIADAEKLYQEAIETEDSIERKTNLYIDLSGAYYDQGLYEEAIAAALKADELNPDKFLVSDWLSRIYEDRKDYEKSAFYYRQAGDWADSNQNKVAISKEAYYANADRVEDLARETNE